MLTPHLSSYNIFLTYQIYPLYLCEILQHFFTKIKYKLQ
jgi:hypothetical protein